MRNSIFPKREPGSNSWLLSFSWEQRKFSDITFPAGEKNKDNLPLESYSITNEAGFVPQDEKFENGGTMREADKRMYYIVTPNSFAYNPARINVGSIGYQNTLKNVIVSSLYEVFKTTDDVNDRLLWHWFKSPDFRKLIEQLQEGGVRLYFYYDKLCMGKVYLPEIDEQGKIGIFFDTLDRLITLHQCNYFFNATEMVSRNVEKTFSWEQRKVREVTEDYVEKTVIQNQYPVLTSSQQQGIVLQEKYFADRQVTTSENIGYFVLPRGFFTYRSRSDTDVFVFNRNMLIDKGIISKYYPVFSAKDTVPEFLLRRLNFGIRKQLSMAAEGTGQKVLAHSKFKDMLIVIPEPREQEKIGAFFESLDRLITLHQRECFFSRIRKKLKITSQKTNAWEQREFSSFAQRRSEISDEATLPRIEYEDIIPDQGILNKDIFQKESMKKGIWFSKGDVLFGKLRPYLKNWFLPYFSGLAVGDFWVLYAKQGDPAFLYYLLQTPEFFFISNQSSGSKMPRADWSLVSQYKFSFPSEKTEQEKIGQFFKSLDSLVTLHQRERLFLILEEILC